MGERNHRCSVGYLRFKQSAMKRFLPLLLVIIGVVIAWFQSGERIQNKPTPNVQEPQPRIQQTKRIDPFPFTDAERIDEINKTLERIRTGQKEFKQDGTVFRNAEGGLPEKPTGYYHEYTVVTPGAGNRGRRRIIQGSEGETYYTDDHYQTFILINIKGVP